MTEQEFVRQVWRAFDTVEIEGGIKGCQDKFDALAIFRDCGLLEPNESKGNGCE